MAQDASLDALDGQSLRPHSRFHRPRPAGRRNPVRRRCDGRLGRTVHDGRHQHQGRAPHHPAHRPALGLPGFQYDEMQMPDGPPSGVGFAPWNGRLLISVRAAYLSRARVRRGRNGETGSYDILSHRRDAPDGRSLRAVGEGRHGPGLWLDLQDATNPRFVRSATCRATKPRAACWTSAAAMGDALIRRLGNPRRPDLHRRDLIADDRPARPDDPDARPRVEEPFHAGAADQLSEPSRRAPVRRRVPLAELVSCWRLRAGDDLRGPRAEDRSRLPGPARRLFR